MVKVNPKNELAKLWQALPDRRKEKREQDVLFCRLGIKDNKESLQTIGNRYHITRERVRQIQNQGIKGLRKAAKNNPRIFNALAKVVKEQDAILSLPTASKLFLDERLNTTTNQKYLHLFLIANPEINYFKATSNTNPFVTYKITNKQFKVESNKIIKYFKNKEIGEPIEIVAKNLKIELKTLHEIALIHKSLGMKDGNVGPKKFANINPRTTEDKIDYIFNKFHKPMHFSQIGELIKKENLEKKLPTTPTIHNELIKHRDKYVLIGRGTYALTKWGYASGTVKEIAQRILKNSKKKLTREELIEEILKQRQVKRNTIILNISSLKKELVK
jgi:hypothetical protein